jgi:hypothetical protein
MGHSHSHRGHHHHHDHDHAHPRDHNHGGPDHLHSHVHGTSASERAEELQTLSASFIDGFRQAETRPAISGLLASRFKRKALTG